MGETRIADGSSGLDQLLPSQFPAARVSSWVSAPSAPGRVCFSPIPASTAIALMGSSVLPPLADPFLLTEMRLPRIRQVPGNNEEEKGLWRQRNGEPTVAPLLDD